MQPMLAIINAFNWGAFLIGVVVVGVSDLVWLTLSTRKAWFPWSDGYVNIKESGARKLSKAGVVFGVVLYGTVASATGAGVLVFPAALRPLLGGALGALVFGVYNITTLITDKRWAYVSAVADVLYGTASWSLLFWVQGLAVFDETRLGA